MSDSSTRGKFLWYELMTSDPGGAADFYTKVIGWATAAWEGGEMPYTMWMIGEMPVGGLMELPEDARAGNVPPHWVAYIGTPDVDVTLARAQELGATVLVEPMEFPNVGRFAFLADPQGAAFAVYTPAQAPPPGAESPSGPGQFSWHELATSDYESGYAFYSDLFGWEKTDAMDMGTGIYQMYGWGDITLGGMYNKPPDFPAPPHWLLYVTVDDVHAAAERVKESGGQVLNGPMEVPGGDWVAQCLDPQGASFAIHSAASGS